MNIAFLLPSLIYGVFLFSSTGSPMLLALSGATMLVWLFVRTAQQGLDQSVTFLDNRVYLGRRRLPLSPLLWGAKLRTRVYQAAFAQDLKARSLELPESYQALNQEGVFLDLSPTDGRPHLIAIGPTGSGKTQLIRKVAEDFSGAKFAIDFKKGQGLADLVAQENIITDHSSASEVEKFFDRLQEKSTLGLPLLLMVDELGEAIKDSFIAAQLERYAAQGRSSRTFLALANQTLSSIPRTIWVNCATRIALSADAVDVAQLQITAKVPQEDVGLRVGLARLGERSQVIYLPDYSSLPGQTRDDLGDLRSPTGYSLDLIGEISTKHGSSGGNKSKGLNFPLWRAVVDPAKRSKRTIAAKNQVGHGATGEVTGANAVTDISTRLANLGHRIK